MSANPVLEVIDRNSAAVEALQKRVDELAKAIRSANPEGVRAAAETGAAGAVRPLQDATRQALEAAQEAQEARKEFRASRIAMGGWPALVALLVGWGMGGVLGWMVHETYWKPLGICAEKPWTSNDKDGKPTAYCIVSR